MDISVAGEYAGRIKIELWADLLPRTAENFRQLCTGEFRLNGQPCGYKGVSFHRVIRGFMCQGGDVMRGDGRGSISIYGERFADEGFPRGHDAPGLLCMANSGPNTNGSQFYITCAPCSHLDGKHVVFGRVVEGMSIVRMIENSPVNNERPILPITISECGEM